MQQVAGFTAAARQARSRIHHDKAEAARLRGELSTELWHRQRGDAELLRAESVEACGSGSAYLGCGSCGQVAGQLRPSRCGLWRYCMSCRSYRCLRTRGRTHEALKEQRKRYARELSDRNFAWGERFLTLTVEHSGSSAYDFRVIQSAWPTFWRSVKRWLRKHRYLSRETIKRIPYLRVLEITGSGDGHAHAHVWMLTPYLPLQVLRVLWGRAIAKKTNGAVFVPVMPIEQVLEDKCRTDRDREDVRSVSRFRGKPLQYLPWPVMWIGEVDEDGIAGELVKYLTKDTVGKGKDAKPLSPLVYANLIEATEGVRLVCAAIHFWLQRPPPWCECCNVALQLITATPRIRPSLARAPP